MQYTTEPFSHKGIMRALARIKCTLKAGIESAAKHGSQGPHVALRHFDMVPKQPSRPVLHGPHVREGTYIAAPADRQPGAQVYEARSSLGQPAMS